MDSLCYPNRGYEHRYLQFLHEGAEHGRCWGLVIRFVLLLLVLLRNSLRTAMKVVKWTSAEDGNESTVLFQLLGTVVEAGQEKFLPHIPGTVSNIANTIANFLSPVPDPWPQVLPHKFCCLNMFSMLVYSCH